MKPLILQTAYLIKQPAWLLGMALSMASMLQGLLGEGIFYGSNLIYLMTYTMSYGVFIPLAPLAAVMAVSMNLQIAMRKTCCYPHLLRCGNRLYVLEVAVSSALSGGFALAIGWLLALVCTKVVGSAPLIGENTLGADSLPFGILLSHGKPLAYLAIRMLLVFFYGFFCVCCAIPAAVCRQEAAVICLIPFVFLRISQYSIDAKLPIYLAPTRILIGGGQIDFGVWGAVGLNILGILALSGVLVIASMLVFERRLRLD